MIDVLVVDDHPVLRSGLMIALGELEDVRVVGQAGSAAQAVQATSKQRPHVVLMDVDRAGESGITRQQSSTSKPDTAVLMLTMHDADAVVFSALCAGARGYLLKGADQEEIHRAVRAPAAGEALFGAGWPVVC